MNTVKIITRIPNDEDIEEDKVKFLCDLINHVYEKAESGMWQLDAQRIAPTTLIMMLKNKELIIAEINGKIVGCVNINLFNEQTAEFGMLVADPQCRGVGIGRELVNAAERWAIENGRSVMRLELLIPKDWKHPSKEFLKNWYTRIGYVLQHTEPFEKLHPDKIDKLGTTCDFLIYHKQLKKNSEKS